MLLGRLAFLVFVTVVCASADALTFFPSNCSNLSSGLGPLTVCSVGKAINQAYGDSPFIDVQYVDKIDPSYSLFYGSTGFGDLNTVAFGLGGDADSNASVFLIPAAGYAVTLDSFKLGAYSRDRTTNVQILENGVVVLDYGNVRIGENGLAMTFSPGITSSTGLEINWFQTAANVAIDDVFFTLTYVGEPVPEPMTFFAVGAGLLTIAARRYFGK